MSRCRARSESSRRVAQSSSSCCSASILLSVSLVSCDHGSTKHTTNRNESPGQKMGTSRSRARALHWLIFSSRRPQVYPTNPTCTATNRDGAASAPPPPVPGLYRPGWAPPSASFTLREPAPGGRVASIGTQQAPTKTPPLARALRHVGMCSIRTPPTRHPPPPHPPAGA